MRVLIAPMAAMAKTSGHFSRGKALAVGLLLTKMMVHAREKHGPSFWISIVGMPYQLFPFGVNATPCNVRASARNSSYVESHFQPGIRQTIRLKMGCCLR